MFIAQWKVESRGYKGKSGFNGRHETQIRNAYPGKDIGNYLYNKRAGTGGKPGTDHAFLLRNEKSIQRLPQCVLAI